LLRKCLKSLYNEIVFFRSLGRILKAVVAFKGLMIEWVQVKGFNEEFVNDNGQLDLWSESRYQVFRKITENANAAMLHFYSPTLPDLAVRSFMVKRVLILLKLVF
jgi:mediator of RNA polymerase II transcription subunit 27